MAKHYTVKGFMETVEWGCVEITIQNVRAENAKDAEYAAIECVGLNVEYVEEEKE